MLEFRKIHVTVRFWAYRDLYRLILLHFTFKVLTIRLFFSLFLYLFMLKYIIYSPSRLLFVCRECSVLSLSFSICIIQHHLPSFLYSESLMKCRETQPWGGEHTDTSVVYCDFLVTVMKVPWSSKKSFWIRSKAAFAQLGQMIRCSLSVIGGSCMHRQHGRERHLDISRSWICRIVVKHVWGG